MNSRLLIGQKKSIIFFVTQEIATRINRIMMSRKFLTIK